MAFILGVGSYSSDTLGPIWMKLWGCIQLDLGYRLSYPLPVWTWKPKVGFECLPWNRLYFGSILFVESIKIHSESIGSHSDIGGTADTDKTGSFRQFHLFHLFRKVNQSTRDGFDWLEEKMMPKYSRFQCEKANFRSPDSKRKWKSSSSNSSSRTV